jgi:hypothetical protein
MGKRNTMEGQDIFKYLSYIILYNGNAILRKFRQDMKPALNYMHRSMSKFLHGLIIFNSINNLQLKWYLPELCHKNRIDSLT